MYTWVRYYNGVGQYQIVPHFLLNVSQNNTSVIKRDGNQLKTTSTRNDNNSAWTFEPSTMSVAPPFFTYDAATNKIALDCTTPGTAIYYTTNGDDATTLSTAYDEAFTLEAGVTTIKAVSAKGGQTSSVATYIVSFQTTVGTNERPYLIQQYSNRWSDGTIIYYMIPDSPNGYANTTNVPRPTMEWFIKYETTEDGIVYYSLQNKVTGEYLYYDSTQSGGSSKGIVLKTSNEYRSSDNGFKFRITPYQTNFNIVPYGLTSGYMYVHKGSNNTSQSPVTLNNSQNAGNSLWNFVPRSALDLTPPFTAATETCAPYYKLNCVGDNTLYITPPTTGTNVVMSTTADNTVAWYFEEAQAATESDWNTYYYIRHGLTGQYLYYAGVTPPNNNQCFELRSSVDDTDKSRYMYTWVRYYNGVGQYQIVPHFLVNVSLDYTSVINRDGNQLKAQRTRSNNSSGWTFVEVNDMKVATPTFFYDDVNQQFHISCTTPDTKIYYKGYDDAANPPTITLADLTLYTGPFSKEHDYYVAIAARCSDGSDQSDPAIGDPNSARYHYHLIDKSNHEIFSIGSNDETLGLPEAYRSPLVSQYHYYAAENFNTTTNVPTGAEATAVAADIYVTYDVSPLVRLDGTQYYMLRYQNPNNTQLYEEAGDRPKGFPEDTQNKVYYPYTNGKEGFNLYGDQKKDAAFDDGESTRTRFLWYFEGGDPYRVKIRSYNTQGTNYHALPGPYPSYFYTFYGNGGSTTAGHADAAIHTVLTQTDRTYHEPTEYMILNGTGTNTASFPYRLMTTAASGPHWTHLVVSSIDHQWLNAAHEDSKYSSRITNWYQMPELGNDFTQYNKNRQTTAGESDPTQGVNLWYETIALGTDFQIEPLQLLPVLHLVDNHGWEIAHWSMENTEACRNRIKQFNSPLVKEYRWYSGESQTGNNRAITKVTGYYKYYINTARPVATTTDLTSNWMHVNFDDVSQNLNFYVFYDAKDEYGNGNSYLLDLGGKMAEASSSTISYTANGSDYHVGTELKNGVTPPAAMQWLVAANPDLDAENAYNGQPRLQLCDATNTSAGRPEPGKDADRFDPYSLRIESAATTGNYYTVNGSSYAITLTAGTTAQFTYTKTAPT